MTCFSSVIVTSLGLYVTMALQSIFLLSGYHVEGLKLNNGLKTADGVYMITRSMFMI